VVPLEPRTRVSCPGFASVVMAQVNPDSAEPTIAQVLGFMSVRLRPGAGPLAISMLAVVPRSRLAGTILLFGSNHCA